MARSDESATGTTDLERPDLSHLEFEMSGTPEATEKPEVSGASEVPGAPEVSGETDADAPGGEEYYDDDYDEYPDEELVYDEEELVYDEEELVEEDDEDAGFYRPRAGWPRVIFRSAVLVLVLVGLLVAFAALDGRS